MGLRGNTKKYAFLLLLLLLLTGCGKQEAVTETTTAPPETTDPKYLATTWARSLWPTAPRRLP